MNIMRGCAGIVALVAATLASGQQPAAPATAGKEAVAARGLSVANKPWTGDFDAMLERRMIRVLVPYSRTLYFNDKGRERGLDRRPGARLRARTSTPSTPSSSASGR